MSSRGHLEIVNGSKEFPELWNLGFKSSHEREWTIGHTSGPSSVRRIFFSAFRMMRSANGMSSEMPDLAP